MTQPAGIAFYDLDGTLVSSNIVTRYAYFARNLPSRGRALLKFTKLALSVPFFVALDFCSRRVFNEIFFREYRGMSKEWLCAQAEELFERVVLPSVYGGAKALVDGDRERGYRPVLVTGELDFAVGPVVRHFRFDDLISNALVYENEIATGEVARPLIAGREKASAMRKLCARYQVDPARCRAYSDSFSDVPMLEAVGSPAAANPDMRLKRIALKRHWPVLDLKRSHHVFHHREDRTAAGV